MKYSDFDVVYEDFHGYPYIRKIISLLTKTIYINTCATLDSKVIRILHPEEEEILTSLFGGND